MNSKKILSFLIFILSFSISFSYTVIINYEGEITPALYSYLESVFKKYDDAQCFILKFDTLGGYIESAFKVSKLIRSCKKPVVTYVGGPGAKAISAGVIILLSGKYKVMATSTVMGALTPVTLTGKDLDSTMKQKVEQTLYTYAKNLLGNNKLLTDVQEKTLKSIIYDSKTLDEKQALTVGFIDLVVDSDFTLINWLYKKKVIKDKEIEEVEPTFLEKFTMFLAKPSVNSTLIQTGLLLMGLEFFVPGTLAFLTVGIILFVLGLIGASYVGINWMGFILMLLGIGLIIAEVILPTFGILGIIGIVLFIIGGNIFLPYKNLITFIVIFVFLLVAAGIYLILKWLEPSKQTYSLVGRKGKVKIVDGKYKVFIEGTWWNATSDYKLEDEQLVMVIAQDSLNLKVKPIDEKEYQADKNFS